MGAWQPNGTMLVVVLIAGAGIAAGLLIGLAAGRGATDADTARLTPTAPAADSSALRVTIALSLFLISCCCIGAFVVGVLGAILRR